MKKFDAEQVNFIVGTIAGFMHATIVSLDPKNLPNDIEQFFMEKIHKYLKESDVIDTLN